MYKSGLKSQLEMVRDSFNLMCDLKEMRESVYKSGTITQRYRLCSLVLIAKDRHDRRVNVLSVLYGVSYGWKK